MLKFKSVIYQEKGIIDATQLYKDIEDFLEWQKEKLQVEKVGRKHPLQHVLNSTSGGYVSPSAMSSFELCPAGYLAGKLFQEKKGSATSIGRTFHNIMDKFYSQEDRTKPVLDKITEETIEEDGQFEKADEVKYYVEGYWNSDDYLGGKMNHESLQCATEVFIKPVINPLGVSLNVPVYLLIDRIDVRDEGIFIVDYKTGKGNPNPYLLGEFGYLPQMIFYKWGVEAEYGEQVKSVLLSVPGAYDKELRWVHMNVHSLVEQSKVIEKVARHLDRIRKTRETKQFDTTIMRYCNSCPIKEDCMVRAEKMNLDINSCRKEIPIEIDILDSTYEEETEEKEIELEEKED